MLDLEEPVAKSGTTSHAVGLQVLRCFQCLGGRQSYFQSQIIIKGIVGVDGRWVGVEATAINLDGNVEAYNLLPLRVGTVFLRFVGVEPVGADKLADELVSGMSLEIFVAWYECFLPLWAFHNPYREVELG